jgi:NAD(P)H-hydrate epimerase
MKIFTSEQIRDLNRRTVEADGVTSLQLVERMAEGVTCEVISRLRANMRVAIFAGPGNNGAYALAAARMLCDQGYHPEVFLFNKGGNLLTAECVACRDALVSECSDRMDFVEVNGLFNLPHLSKQYVVVDGLFGSDLNEPLSRGFCELVKFINDSGATIVAIDLPTGLMGEWNPHTVSRNIIHATVTMSVQFPRLAFMIPDNAELVGEWKTVDLGLNEQEIRRMAPPFYLIERDDVKRLLNPRPLYSSKADFGSALLVAGSYGMMGAAVLAARGALRAGVGKVSVYAPLCGCEVMQTAVPEAIFVAANSKIATTEIRPPRRDYTAIGIGPGLGTAQETISALANFIKIYEQPLVVDADALNCISMNQSILHHLPILSILTPHAGEFDRIFGVQASAEARLVKAIEMARYHNVLIVLKGRHTTIVRPDGRLYFNSSGTPAMATPGAGDVLTGIITGLMAQGYKPEIAAIAGVYIHGLAGEIAAEKEGTYGVTAGDIAACVGRAIKQIMQ